MTDTWNVLDDRTEQDLHKNRLLNVEERPFKRITKRLHQLATTLAAPPSATDIPHQKRLISFLREDLTNDFSIFDSSLSRIQFLLNANTLERARYDSDKQRILDECQAVRDQNVTLREELEDSRATLRKRKRFDDLADKITANRLLRPRDDQRASLKNLEDECAELERERETYAETWRERKEQFNRIMNEGMELRRQIRDEAEEVDRRQGMDADDEEATEGTPQAAGTPRAPASRGSTPRLDGKDESISDAEGTGREVPQQKLGSNLRSELGRSRSRSQGRTPSVREGSARPEVEDDDDDDDEEEEEEEEEEKEEEAEEGEEEDNEDDDGEIEEGENVEMVQEPVRRLRRGGQRNRHLGRRHHMHME